MSGHVLNQQKINASPPPPSLLGSLPYPWVVLNVEVFERRKLQHPLWEGVELIVAQIQVPELGKWGLDISPVPPIQHRTVVVSGNQIVRGIQDL